jgi:hypothetical protein
MNAMRMETATSNDLFFSMRLVELEGA